MSDTSIVNLIAVKQHDGNIHVYRKNNDRKTLLLNTNGNSFKSIVDVMATVARPDNNPQYKLHIEARDEGDRIVANGMYKVTLNDGETPSFMPDTDAQFAQVDDLIYSGISIVKDAPNFMLITKAKSIYQLSGAMDYQPNDFANVPYSDGYELADIHSENARLMEALRDIQASYVYLPNGYLANFSSKDMNVSYPVGRHVKDRHPALQPIPHDDIRLVQRGMAGSFVTRERVNQALEEIGAPHYHYLKQDDKDIMLTPNYNDQNKISLGFAGHISNEALVSTMNAIQKERAIVNGRMVGDFSSRSSRGEILERLSYLPEYKYAEFIEHALLGMGAPYGEDTKNKAASFADEVVSFHHNLPDNTTNKQYKTLVGEFENSIVDYAKSVRVQNVAQRATPKR